MQARRWLRLTLLATVAIAAGCAVFPRDPSKPTATDVVCLENGDLGCVTITVDETTPRAEVEGKTYYFCSDHCRDLFLATPDKYLAAGQARR